MRHCVFTHIVNKYAKNGGDTKFQWGDNKSLAE